MRRIHIHNAQTGTHTRARAVYCISLYTYDTFFYFTQRAMTLLDRNLIPSFIPSRSGSVAPSPFAPPLPPFPRAWSKHPHRSRSIQSVIRYLSRGCADVPPSFNSTKKSFEIHQYGTVPTTVRTRQRAKPITNITANRTNPAAPPNVTRVGAGPASKRCGMK